MNITPSVSPAAGAAFARLEEAGFKPDKATPGQASAIRDMLSVDLDATEVNRLLKKHFPEVSLIDEAMPL